MTFRVHGLTATLASFLELAACAGGPSMRELGPSAPDDGGTKSSCSRAGDSYTHDLARTSSGGTFAVRLLGIHPDPPGMGENTWRFELFDETGAPASGAEVIVTSYMPDHNHAGPSIAVDELGNGVYRAVTNIVLMAGLYRFSIALERQRDDTAVYEFCAR